MQKDKQLSKGKELVLESDIGVLYPGKTKEKFLLTAAQEKGMTCTLAVMGINERGALLWYSQKVERVQERARRLGQETGNP